MTYEALTLPILSDRPFFYTSFVSTVDGKIQVTTDPKGYWPIGSMVDYKAFTMLRAHGDIIIQGKNTARMFGNPTIQTISKQFFLKRRKNLKKNKPIEYAIITSSPDDSLIEIVKNESGIIPIIITTKKAKISELLLSLVQIVRIGEKSVGLKELEVYLQKNGYKHVFLDGGSLVSSFLAERLLDEIFLTIAPKIFGNKDNAAITMIEHSLFEPTQVPQFEIISVEKVKNELFVRYRRK